jgi:putative SOS response-associated peptidase YedK
MCGRYAASRKPEDLAGLFEVEYWDPEETLEPDWNVAPTKNVFAVLQRPLKGAENKASLRQLRVLRWGLVPSWAKTPESSAKMINARSETVHEKPAYKRAFLSRRCLLPADGYYEWFTPAAEFAEEQKGARKRPRKQPWFITPADGSVMAMAGLFEFWRDRTLPDDHPRAWWSTCTVLTTEAETTPFARPSSTTTVDRRRESAAPSVAHGGDGPQSLADIHPRMPLMLEPERWAAWLDPANGDVDRLLPLLAPPPAGLIRAYPVGPEVSNVRNNSAELLEPLAERAPETLF